MAEDKKDFKEVKVKITGGQKEHTDTLSRSMLYSGVNIFGQLSELYMQSKDQFTAIALQHSGQASKNQSGANTTQDDSGSGAQGMMSLNANVLQIFKRLQKRDAVTKVKAFQELEVYLKSVEQGSDELSNLLTFFLYHMCRILMNERDKKVRESAHQAFAAFIKKGKRKLGPHLKKIFPLWLCSFFDPSPEVARLAQANFANAFPEAKQGAVFKIVFKNFLHFADEQLRSSEESAAHLEGLSQEAVQESFDRITSSVLLALAHSFRFIEDWSPEEQDQFKNKLLDILDLNNATASPVEEEVQPEQAPEDQKVDEETKVEAQPAGKKRGRGRRGLATESTLAAKKARADKQQAQNYMWAFLSQNYRGRVRAACLQFVSVFINRMPNEVVSSQLSQFAPLVFNLVGDQNSLLQTSLWRDAIFNIGKMFPNCWTYVNIKKDFLPKLNKCLKESGYGAPVTLYENFVKYVSICPVYQLSSTAQPNEGKLNKISFKERCNLLRELMQSLFAGLKNDESVAFHVELVSSYFETLTFLLLKRVQPMLQDALLKEEDKNFAILEIAKVIRLPLTEFVAHYAKFKSAVQNARNIRVQIPKRFAKMLVDLAERDVDRVLFTAVCEQFYECLDHTERNSGRLYSTVLKTLGQSKGQYREIISKTALGPMVANLSKELTQEIPNANKQTVEGVVKKCTLLRRLLYTMNKNANETSDMVADFEGSQDLTLPSGELLLKVQITEKMALKVLTKENLDNFMMIKTCLVESTILMMNLGWTQAQEQMLKILTQGIFIDKLASPLLQKGTDQLEQMVFQPETTIQQKVHFDKYFEAVRENDEIHDAMIDTMSDKMLLPEEIMHYKSMIATCIDRQTKNQPTPLTEEDVDVLKSFVIIVLQGEDVAEMSLMSLAAYFTASKDLLEQVGDEQNEEMRELLFELLLTRKVERIADKASYEEMWTVFKGALKGKQDFVQLCIDKLGASVTSLINSDSNNLQGVAEFQHLTTLIHKFVHLQDDKVSILKQIVLIEGNFANLEKNPLPLKMFRDLFLDGSVNFDISVLMGEKADDGSYNFAWLLASMLNFKYLVSLTNFLELKNQLIIFVESDVIPGIIVGDKPMIVSLVQTVADKALSGEATNSFQLTLEYFVQKLVDPGEEFPADMKPVLIDDFKEILDRIGKQTALKLIETNFAGNGHNVRAIDTLVRLLSQISYFILDEPVIKDLFNLVKTNIKTVLEVKTDLSMMPLCSYQIRLYMALAKYFEPSNQTEMTANFQIDLVNYILESQDSAEVAFKSVLQQVAIEITGGLLDEAPKDIVKDKLNSVEVTNNIIEMLMQISEQADNPEAFQASQIDCRTLIQLCSVLKKTFGWTPELSGTLVSIFIQAVRDRAAWFDKRVKEQAISMAGGLQQLEVEMLKEMGETLLVCVSYISEEALKAHIENNLYSIIGCRVEGLQKAAFVLLKFIYENFIPPVVVTVTEEDELRQLKEDFPEEIKSDAEESKEEKSRGKAAIAFQNVSTNLIELIDNAPNVIQQDTDGVQTQLMASNEVLEKLVLGENQEGCMTSKIYGYFLAWNAMLIKIEQGRIKSQLTQATQYQSVLASLTDYLEANSPIYEMLLVSLVPYFPIVKKSISSDYGRELADYQPEYLTLSSEKDCRVMCLHTLISFMKSFPSLARKFYDSCDKQILNVTKPYIKNIVSPAIMENEIKKIELAQLELGDSNLTFVLYKSTKEIVATYDKNNEVSVQIKLKIPNEYPLKSVVVDLTDQLKLKAGLMRKWSLSIRNLIQSRNGDIISAILLWKSNIDNEMDGVEDCSICYCVLHGTDRSLPTLPCKNCNNKFHVNCIRKWFNTSNKSNCPLCQTFFWQ